MKIDPDKLTQALKNRKIDDLTIQSLAEEAKITNTSLYDVVEKRHILSDDELGKVVAEIIAYPYINLSKIEIPNEILEIVPENIALKQGIITFGIDERDNKVKIATKNPFDLDMIHALEKKIGREAEVYYTTDAAEGVKVVMVAEDPSRSGYAKLKEKVGETQASELFPAFGYDAAQIISEAIAKVGYNGTAIKDYLYQMPTFKGIACDVTFDENGDNNVAAGVKVARNGEFIMITE